MKRIALFVYLALAVFSAFSDSVSAQQGLPVDGKDFYIGFVYPSFNKNADQSGRGVKGFFGVYALISSYDNNQVTLSYFDPNTGQETQSNIYSISAKNAVQVPLQIGAMKLKDTGEVPEYRACHITAKKPVNVQYFSTGACSGGSYLAIPTPALGQHYVIPSYFDNPDGAGAGSGNQTEPSSGFFMVIGAFDGTLVTITPNSRTMGGHVGVNTGTGATGNPVPFAITLNRGQCAWFKGDASDNSSDISGSTVVSTKPIGVLAGHEDAFLGGAPTQRVLEGRDFMIEQVIPAEYWDSTGYVSIPLVGTSPIDESAAGYGSNYRVFTDNPKGAKAVFTDACRGDFDMTVSRFTYPTPEQINVACPIDISSSDGHKFGVMLYELRDQGTKEPYPAESMMTIVPMSRWRTSFLFYVPANTFELLQDYYINVIGEKNDMANNATTGGIMFSHDGSPLQKLSGLSSHGSFPNIPHHPELVGKQYSVHPGAYYLTNTRTKLDSTSAVDMQLQGAFMVYHYGMRAIDPDRDLGDFCGDDFFFSYALPIGMTVASGLGNPQVTVDTFCSHWHVCVHDSLPITSATLIDDPDGNVYGKPGKTYFNAQFDPKDDPDDKREIVFNGTDTSVCFDVLVSNPLDSAYAPLYIVDKSGTHIIEELHYRAQAVKLLLEQPQPTLTYVKVDTLNFPVTQVGQKICSTIVYVNTSAKGGPSVVFNSITLKNNNFSLASVTPTPPFSLLPGDTIRVQICFPVNDTLTYLDTLIASTGCAPFPLTLIGKGGTPLIYATDVDFGSVAVGTTLCKTVTVFNKGTFPFVLTKNWVLHNTALFSMDPTSAATLPITIPPGGHWNLTFCYSPTQIDGGDSTSVDWITDIEAQYKDQIKSWSFLKGKPIKPGVIWDRQTQLDSVICEDSIVIRVNLINNSTTETGGIDIFFDGPDAAEYTILKTQSGKIKGNDMLVHDTMWVDVMFKADLTKTGLAKYAPRHANLVATYNTSTVNGKDSTVILFTDLVQHAVLVFNPTLLDFGYVTKGQPATGFVTVIDTGDAPFVIKSLTFPNPPISGISLKGKPLSIGDTIGRGDTITLAIDAQLDQYIDTTVGYALFSDHACGDFSAKMHIAASSRLVFGTGYPAPNVFVNCHEHDSIIVFTSKGSAPITLKSVSITAQNPPGQFDLIDSKGAKGTSITTNTILKLGQSDTIRIVYHPTIAGPATATIQYSYDSAGTQFTLTKQASGTGVHLSTTLSAKGAGQYTANTGASFSIPVSLVDSTFPLEADVREIKFRMTYAKDVVDYKSVTSANAKYTVNSPATGTSAGNGMEYLDLDIKSNTQITNPENLIAVKYEAMVAIQTVSPFILSDVVFFNAAGDTICFISYDTIPGVFVPSPLCGDTTLRNYLSGVFPVRITMLSPGIVNENESPVLYYSVSRTDVPVRVEIYNVLGEKVRTIKNTMTQPVGEYKLPIGTRGLPSGQYVVRVVTSASEESANFILEK